MPSEDPRRVALTLAAVLAVAVLAWAHEPAGVPFGPGRASAELASLTDRPDVDEFVAPLLDGESLSVTVAAVKGSAARFDVAVLDPDGGDRTASGKVRVRKDGARVQVAGVPVDATGTWTVRISGRDGAEGGYQASFKVGAAKGIKLRKQPLGGAAPADRVHAFGGLAGGTLDLKLAWSRKGAPVVLDDVRGPDGTVSGIFGEGASALREKATSLQLRKHPLDAGDGTYEVALGSEGSAEYALSLRVAAPPRPNGAAPLVTGNDPHLATRSEPVRTAPGQVVRIEGRNFGLSPLPTVFFGAYEAEVAEVGPARTWIDVVVPPAPDGALLDLLVVNPDGQSARHPAFVQYVPEAAVEAVEILLGDVLGDRQVPLSGGTLLEVRGRHFQPTDIARLGDDVVERTSFSATRFRVELPAGAAGLVPFTLTDEFGRVQAVPDVLRRVGFSDGTAATVPAASDVDDLSAFAGAIGDLDRLGKDDDLVIVTFSEASRAYVAYGPDPDGIYAGGVPIVDNPIGTREVYARLLLANNRGILIDRTATNMPAQGADAAGREDWNALAVAIGDVDGERGNDIVLGGARGAGDPRLAAPQVRVLVNDGIGRFAPRTALAPPTRALPSRVAVDETYIPPTETNPGRGAHPIGGPRIVPPFVSSLAVGDLDGDGDVDVVAGSPGVGSRYLEIDPSRVDYGQDPPYVRSSDVVAVRETFYYSGVRVLRNTLPAGVGLEDVTEEVLPSAGSTADPGHVAFPARHLALGDVDGDDDLDLLVTWNNPASLVPESAVGSYGGYFEFSYGAYGYEYDAGTAQPVVATRVLLNDGDGAFEDATDTWMPEAAGDEHWQAHRLALADLDGDGDLDLVLLHRRALNAYRYRAETAPPASSRPSLRILRNDGSAYVDVTATALPPLPVGETRGRALAIADVDLDGVPDLLFGTSEPRADGAATVPSTRILWGRPGLRFEMNEPFMWTVGAESGEVHALLVGDVDTDGVPSVLFLGEALPANGPGQLLRLQDWLR